MYFHTFQNNCIPQSETEQEVQGFIIPVGYVNATAMVQVSEKKINDYLRLKSTNAKLVALSINAKIPVSDIIIVIKHGDPTEQGTWVHPELSIDIAQWCSVDMWVWASLTISIQSRWIFNNPDPSLSKFSTHYDRH
jgi:hypothetical protein